METEPQTIPDEETRQLEQELEYRAGVPEAREEAESELEELLEDAEEAPPFDLTGVPF